MKVVLTLVWIVGTVIWVALLFEPTGTQAQFVLGGAGCAAMAFIGLFRRTGVWRTIFQALGTGIVLRYLFWRCTSTLPSPSDLPSFVFGAMLFAAELYSIVMLFVSLFVVADPVERPPAPALAEADLPTVDVFVPTYDEDQDLLALTLAAATAIRYPRGKLKVHLLDDGGTDQKCGDRDGLKAKAAQLRRATLQDLAREVGATYHTRARNLHAKAGNLNAALGRTSGEIVAVFDADHVPMPDFLEHTVGHFRRDPRLFLCQTPHFFSNPDPIERNLVTFDSMPSENEMFYGVIQRGLDRWNAAFFCGSAALVRRAALEEVGGFSGVSITEDCETALELHARGWTSVYVDRPLVSGLQPGTLASFIGQRSRWCRGMFQIFLLKNPLLKRGLSVPQRISYLSNMTYWFFPLFRLPFLVAPFLYIWFSLQIYVANIHEFFSYTMIYMIANIMMQNYMYGSVRWPLISELYEYVQSIYLVRGLLSVVLAPRKPTFDVTDKRRSLEHDFVSELALPYFVVFGLVLLSQLYAGYRYLHEIDNGDLLVVVSAWNLLNLVLAGAGLGVVAERRVVPEPLGVPAELTIHGTILPATIDRITPRCCRLAVDLGPARAAVSPGVAASLDLLGRAAEASVLPLALTAVGEGSAEFAFVGLRPEHFRAIVSVLYPGSEALDAFRSRRRRHKSIVGGIARIVAWGVAEPVRAFRLLAGRAAERRRPAPVGDARGTVLAGPGQAPDLPFAGAAPAPAAGPVDEAWPPGAARAATGAPRGHDVIELRARPAPAGDRGPQRRVGEGRR